MKRVAIPILNGQLSKYFGQCNHYEIFDIVGNLVIRDVIEIPSEKNKQKLPEWVSGLGITDIITHKLDNGIIKLFAPFRINLFIGIPIKSPQWLIEEYINGKLKSDKSIILEMMDKN